MARTPFSHAIVVGASSGIGEALARRIAREGGRVALVARRAEALERICDEINREAGEERAIPVAHDVLSREEVPWLFQETARRLGGLDLVVYAAGIMPRIDVETYDTPTDTSILETNLLGAIAWLNEAAMRFERVGSGTIVGIGSIAGDRGRRGNPAYCTSKGGLAIYLESLRNRLTRGGVRVLTVKPGFVETAMTEGVPKLFWLITPDRAAEIVLNAARRGAGTIYVPARWRLVATVVRSIPSILFHRLDI